jgi:hypothetical protein
LDFGAFGEEDCEVEGEVPKRLKPVVATVRELALKSGNLCCYPGCDRRIMDADGLLLGEICHIEAALPDGSRFNSASNNEARREPSNLFLMCFEHHAVVDARVDEWDVDRLRALKAEHESRFTAAIGQLRDRVEDVTEGATVRPPANARAIWPMLTDEERDGTVEMATAFLEHLARVPVDARELLAIMLKRGNAEWMDSGDAVSLPLRELEAVTTLSRHEVIELMEILERHELGGIDYEDGPPRAYTGDSTRLAGWPFFSDVREFAGADMHVIDRVVVDLDLTVFDA